jgi:hypothetical protein
VRGHLVLAPTSTKSMPTVTQHWTKPYDSVQCSPQGF